jgi:hypothetical protein
MDVDKVVPSFRPSAEFLAAKRGPIDGQKFFSRSPFRSGYFLIASLFCFISLLLDAEILFRYWQKLSTFGAGLFWFIGVGLALSWWRAFSYVERVRDLYRELLIKEAEPGSPLDITLGVAAGAINIILFLGSSVTALLLGYTRNLLGRIPGR